MKDRRVQSETGPFDCPVESDSPVESDFPALLLFEISLYILIKFLKTRSRALMRMGHDEVHLLAWGRHMETRSAAGPIAGGVMSSLPYSNPLRRWLFEPAG